MCVCVCVCGVIPARPDEQAAEGVRGPVGRVREPSARKRAAFSVSNQRPGLNTMLTLVGRGVC